MSFCVYILHSELLDKYYVGSCEEKDARLQQHNAGRNKSTKPGMPWVMKYSEEYSCRADAVRREMEIKKKKSRKYIEWLISSVG